MFTLPVTLCTMKTFITEGCDLFNNNFPDPCLYSLFPTFLLNIAHYTILYFTIHNSTPHFLTVFFFISSILGISLRMLPSVTLSQLK